MQPSLLRLKLVSLIFTLPILACTSSFAGPIDVFILAGQSNAAGRGLSADLSSDLDSLGVSYDSYAANSNSLLYANREREVADLSIIHDQPFGDLRIKDYIVPWRGELGPELSLGRDLASVNTNPVALIKYTVGGTHLDRWDGPGDLYPDFYDYLGEMAADLATAGHTVQWRGIFWVQGENDALTDERAALYTSRINQLRDRLSTDLGASDLPFVMAQLKSNLVDVGSRPYSESNPRAQVINSEMGQLAVVDPLVAITGSTNDLLVQDGIHYTSNDYIELGHRLADAYKNTWLYSADFNGDTVVDGADFLNLQRNFGANGALTTLAMGDANEDELIDYSDLVVWETQFGKAQPAVMASVAVPEPSSLLLACLSGLICCCRRRR